MLVYKMIGGVVFFGHHRPQTTKRQNDKQHYCSTGSRGRLKKAPNREHATTSRIHNIRRTSRTTTHTTLFFLAVGRRIYLEGRSGEPENDYCVADDSPKAHYSSVLGPSPVKSFPGAGGGDVLTTIQVRIVKTMGGFLLDLTS